MALVESLTPQHLSLESAGDMLEVSKDSGLTSYYINKVEEMAIMIRDKTQNLERLKAQRNELNTKVRLMREELTQLHEPGSYIGEVVKPMGKARVLVKVNPEGKYVVDLDKDIDVNKCTPNTRVALKSDSYTLHKILRTRVDPLVSLMKVIYKHNTIIILYSTYVLT
jgi:26S proteasome regulatory subunit T6